MPFLYEKIDVLRENGYIKSVPDWIPQNLNPAFELRPYQINAFENFITFFEGNNCPHPTQTLFHMATGSGKTLIMAGLMIYLYKHGYRNFLFFVNLSTIVKKTEDNFLNVTSSKYLFADDIVIDGERVRINKVENFQASDPDAINICFSTTQGLHTDMWFCKENAMSFDDFDGVKTVLISDEAHHLNASTKKMNKEEEESYHSWEQTVRNIFSRDTQNVLLEFTATCDLNNPLIKAEYESKIVFDYPLVKFRADLYSKEIKTLRSDMDIMDRAIQALVLSQYRLKVFQDNHIAMKPVVLFKSAKIKESQAYMEEFISKVKNLSGETLERIAGLIDNPTMQKAFEYFKRKGISMDSLAQELREDFAEEHCVSVNDDKEADAKQILLNSLEDATNPYRAIFEVKKLDEGWDVLNLFDIVRLYETRQSGGKSIAPATVSEAQLIGRGARYCPFRVDDEQPKFQRKYDEDTDNELRICEELYYHCQNDSRYIGELHNALREIGIEIEKTKKLKYVLKQEFKSEAIYKDGLVFINERVVKSRKDVVGLLPSIIDKPHVYSLATGQSGEDIIMSDEKGTTDSKAKLKVFDTSIGQISQINYAIVNKALAKFPVFRFNALKDRFPNLKSTREFITSSNYLGNIKISIKSKYDVPPANVLMTAVVRVLEEVAASISEIEETYEGTKSFRAVKISEVFKDKSINVEEVPGGKGVSQDDHSVAPEMRFDLSQEDWYAYNDNFGTSEEKAFVAYFRDYVEQLKKAYSRVFLLRNERAMHLYSFDGGERFEPDYVLFLQQDTADGCEQLQVFVEPKGSHLIEKDQWKEDFMLQMRDMAVAKKTFVDDNHYYIWGLHFFNRADRDMEFRVDFDEISQPDVVFSYARKIADMLKKQESKE